MLPKRAIGVTLIVAALAGCSGKTRSGFSGDDSDDVCAAAHRLAGVQKAFANTDSSPDGLRTAYHPLVDAWNSAATAAPSEIRSSLRRVNDATQEYWAVLAKAGFDLSQVPQSERVVLPEQDQHRVEAYFDEVCGVGVDG